MTFCQEAYRCTFRENQIKGKFLGIRTEATHSSSIIRYEFINKDDSHLVTHNKVNNLDVLKSTEYVTFCVFVFFSTWKRGKYELCVKVCDQVSGVGLCTTKNKCAYSGSFHRLPGSSVALNCYFFTPTRTKIKTRENQHKFMIKVWNTVSVWHWGLIVYHG